MSGGDGGRRGRRRALSQEELNLWRAVTKDDAPLKGRAAKPRVIPKTSQPDPSQASAPPSASSKPAPATPSPPHAKRLRPAGSPEPHVSIRRTPEPIDRLGPATPGLDRNTARRLKQGKMAPDARIDLHGMTAERAHRALTSFLMREHAAGSRCVLVITGKGGRARESGRYEMRDLPEGAGVLKSQTPHWLATPPLSQLVVGVYQAHIRHGGAGALYVYLRKPRR